MDLTYDRTQSKAEEKIYNYEDKEGFNHDYDFDIQKLILSFGYQFIFFNSKESKFKVNVLKTNKTDKIRNFDIYEI